MICRKTGVTTREDIRGFVRWLKKKVGLQNVSPFPIVFFFETILPQIVQDFNFEILPVEEMETKYGETIPGINLIRIREDVYYQAVEGEENDKKTIAHEIGHLLMHDDIILCKVAEGEQINPCEDPEWQADVFAEELLS